METLANLLILIVFDSNKFLFSPKSNFLVAIPLTTCSTIVTNSSLYLSPTVSQPILFYLFTFFLIVDLMYSFAFIIPLFLPFPLSSTPSASSSAIEYKAAQALFSKCFTLDISDSSSCVFIL